MRKHIFVVITTFVIIVFKEYLMHIHAYIASLSAQVIAV